MSETTQTLEGHIAFEKLTHGLATGDWEPFLSLLTDDFSFWFPIGPYHELNIGKAKAAEFFQYVTQTFAGGLAVESVDRVTSNLTTVVFESRDQGLMNGQAYKNRVAVSFDIRGDKVCGYREYFGSDGKSN